MKKISLALLATLFLTASYTAHAENEQWGIGAILGDPTALTGEYNISESRAIDAAFGYSWGHSVLIYSDYLFEFPGSVHTDNSDVNQIVPYVGIGPELRFYSADHQKEINNDFAQTVFSARIPLGIAWHIPKSTVQVFAEIAPMLNLAPGLDVDVQGGIGARFFF